MKKTPALLALSCFVLGAPVMGGDFYMGAGIGEVDDTAFRVAAGYEVNRWFALELAYADLGDIDAPLDGAMSISESDLVGAFAVATFHVTPRAALFGRAGIAYWDSTRWLIVADETIEMNMDGNDFAHGYGFSYDLSRQVSVQLEFDRYELDDVDVHMKSVGLRVTF